MSGGAPSAVVSAYFSKTYRPEVDGLRSIAVISVLLFHAGFAPFGGGFIGVDVFFVISGYLITQIIYADCERGKFRFLPFMARRVARLYPALMATLLLVMAAGFALFDPAQYKTLAASTAGAFFSASNFLFWQVAGYFDTSSELNPLLHTWSLGVEQQFYLIWPLIIYAAWRWRHGHLPQILLLAGALSLAASQWFTALDPSANYYLMPFRMFEFAAGGVLPWLERRRMPRNAGQECLLAAGLALLLYSVLAFDRNTIFPGVNALLPVAGAALCIYAGRARYLGAVLRNRAAVSIGLISYSLYLVHWPLIVFYKYHVYRPLGFQDKALLFALPFLLAYPLYRWVECRYRKIDLLRWPAPKAAFRAAALALTLAPAAWVYYGQGLPFRVNEQYRARALDPAAQEEGRFGGEAYALDAVLGDKTAGQPAAVFAGDSFALQYAAGFDYWLKAKNIKMQGVFQHGCILGRDVTRLLNGQPREDCLARTAQLQALLKGNDLALVYAMSWTGYRDLLARPDGRRLEFASQAEYGRFLAANVLDLIADNPARKLIVIGTQPGIRANGGVAACLERPDYLPMRCLDALSLPRELGLGYDLNRQMARAFAAHPRVLFLDPYDVLCEQGVCLAMGQGRLRYSDTSHLSLAGSLEVSRAWVDKIIKFLGKPAT
ncbi:acyltransferase family protein [Pollutimonas bauzanensis]|uniref:Peptidoglycan/LPS O-acetylase OafA/YrhL, contains acyltransferase and SGNH-hydrolase domains n=1 Tax=Pollutimonas bauzanensis TaxID=658167 RepID=A0A1M6ALT9_9BURK|nr:acyltransferase family protein [Pollutimonas bauzanensis]SHI37183.1 Peptidoglycan/LPS O-acetylase OafA/YrhL, contains acyltransferase and SGNH-hydrolase domains [Pollutimonas bauzanensis]